MSLLNSSDPAIAAAQAKVHETLAGIPDEYGAVFVIDQYQAELKAAVQAERKRAAMLKAARRLNELHARKAKKAQVRGGFEKIGRAMNEGVEVENWERHWIELLREYEALSDELAAAVPEQVELAGMPRQEVANAA